MNTLDWINLVQKIVLLNLIIACSELSLRKHFFNLWFLMLSLFITYFRTTLLRAISIYVGVFAKLPANKVIMFRDFLQGSLATTVTDSIILVSIIFTYFMLQSAKKINTKKNERITAK